SHFSPSTLLRASAFGGHHELYDLLGHLGLKAFGVSFVEAQDVGDDAFIFATFIDPHFRRARTRLTTPANAGRILATGVPHIAGFLVDDFGALDWVLAAELVGDGRCVRHRSDFPRA